MNPTTTTTTTSTTTPTQPATTPVTPPGMNGTNKTTAPLAHVLGIDDIQVGVPAIVQSALALKQSAQSGPLPQTLAGTATALVFENPSTRTRVSLELGIARLGGATTTLDAKTTQLGRGESIEDTAGALSRYTDAIVVRAKKHTNLEEFARHATVPVINALTDKEHPLQALADLMTIAEAFAPAGEALTTGPQDPAFLQHLQGLTLAWVGDGNNVCHSLMLASLQCGMNVQVATPPGYEPDAEIVGRAQQLASAHDCTLLLTDDPYEAVSGAHVVETDTWRSMGSESETVKRLLAFNGYTVDQTLMDEAAPEAVFLHCMPGHWGEEATYAVAHGPASLMFDQAENRMWTQMALLVQLLDKV